jgi:3-oxoacyl-[acyl-carrier protein] reductase
VGPAIALGLAAEGANVATHGYTNRAGAEETARDAAKLGVRAVTVMSDVGDPAQVRAMVDEAVAGIGSIDILVCCPGLRPHPSTLDVTIEDWRRVMGTNLDGPFLCAQTVLPGMVERGWGRIVNIVGGGASMGMGPPHLAASKAGLLGLSRSLAAEFAKDGVLVNMISPGIVRTHDSPYRDAGRDYEAMAARTRTRTLVEPEEIADVCVLLCDPAQRSMTGQIINVSSGGGG